MIYRIYILLGVNALLLFLRREIDRMEYGDKAGIILFNFRNQKFFIVLIFRLITFLISQTMKLCFFFHFLDTIFKKFVGGIMINLNRMSFSLLTLWSSGQSCRSIVINIPLPSYTF